MNSPKEKLSQLSAENLEIRRAADVNSILLCEVLRQNRKYSSQIKSLKDRLTLVEKRNRTLFLRSKINVAKNKKLQRQNGEYQVMIRRTKRGLREVIDEIKGYLLNKKVTLSITIENGGGAMPSRLITPRKRQRKLNRKIRQLTQLKNLLKED